jgi:hypothetical protein
VTAVRAVCVALPASSGRLDGVFGGGRSGLHEGERAGPRTLGAFPTNGFRRQPGCASAATKSFARVRPEGSNDHRRPTADVRLPVHATTQPCPHVPNTDRRRHLYRFALVWPEAVCVATSPILDGRAQALGDAENPLVLTLDSREPASHEPRPLRRHLVELAGTLDDAARARAHQPGPCAVRVQPEREPAVQMTAGTRVSFR